MAAVVDTETGTLEINGEANGRNKMRADTVCPALLQLASLPSLKHL